MVHRHFNVEELNICVKKIKNKKEGACFPASHLIRHLKQNNFYGTEWDENIDTALMFQADNVLQPVIVC